MRSRVRTALDVYLFGLLGAFLLAVPWTPLWDVATLSLARFPVGAWLRSGWVRGAVSGLGVLDLVVAARDASVLWSVLRRERSGPWTQGRG